MSEEGWVRGEVLTGVTPEGLVYLEIDETQLAFAPAQARELATMLLESALDAEGGVVS